MSIDRLRELHSLLASLDEDAARWGARLLENYFEDAHTGKTLDDAAGVSTKGNGRGRGGAWWREEIENRRDELFRALSELIDGPGKAEKIASAMEEYKNNSWVDDYVNGQPLESTEMHAILFELMILDQKRIIPVFYLSRRRMDQIIAAKSKD